MKKNSRIHIKLSEDMFNLINYLSKKEEQDRTGFVLNCAAKERFSLLKKYDKFKGSEEDLKQLNEKMNYLAKYFNQLANSIENGLITLTELKENDFENLSKQIEEIKNSFYLLDYDYEIKKENILIQDLIEKRTDDEK